MLNAFFYNLVPAYFDEIREQKQINARYRRKRILEATLSRWKNKLVLVKIMAKRCQNRYTCAKSGSSLDIKRKHRQQCCLRLSEVSLEERASEEQMS